MMKNNVFLMQGNEACVQDAIDAGKGSSGK